MNTTTGLRPGECRITLTRSEWGILHHLLAVAQEQPAVFGGTDEHGPAARVPTTRRRKLLRQQGDQPGQLPWGERFSDRLRRRLRTRSIDTARRRIIAGDAVRLPVGNDLLLPVR